MKFLSLFLFFAVLASANPVQAGFILLFSTTNNPNQTTTAITGNVGDQVTVSLFVQGTDGDAAVLSNDGLFTFGVQGSYTNQLLISPTATPVSLDAAWIPNQVFNPNEFNAGQFFLTGQSDSNFNTPIKGNPIRLGQFQFQIAAQGTSSFSFSPDESNTYTWVDGNINEITGPSGNLSVTGVPEPGALGLLMVGGIASIASRRSRKRG